MNDDAIRSLHEKLRSALHGATSITETDRELLKRLAVDIEVLLAQPAAMTRAKQQPLLDRLRVAITRFEVSHPDLTATMGQVSKTLGDMGI